MDHEVEQIERQVGAVKVLVGEEPSPVVSAQQGKVCVWDGGITFDVKIEQVQRHVC